MRWAFWRTTAYDAPLEPDPRHGSRRGATSTTAPEDPDPDRRPAPASSGASPSADAGLEDLAGVADALAARGAFPAADPPADVAVLRGDVLDLVRAALARDRSAAQAVAGRLAGRGGGATSLARAGALGALGERLVLGAGVDPARAAPGSLDLAAAVAQGDTLTERAEPLLRAVAPDVRRAQVRLVVRVCLGVDEDPGDGDDEDLAVVVCALLAQTVRDGLGDLDALEEELADLLPEP